MPTGPSDNTTTKYKWRINIPAIEAALPEIRDFSLSNELKQGLKYDGPTMFIGGAKSSYIRQDAEHKQYLANFFPSANTTLIPDAGHWVHFDKPNEFVDALKPFLIKTNTGCLYPERA